MSVLIIIIGSSNGFVAIRPSTINSTNVDKIYGPIQWARRGTNNNIMSQIAKFMRPTWGPPGSCRSQMGPILVPWTLLSGVISCKPGWIQNDRQNTIIMMSHHGNAFRVTGPSEGNPPVTSGFPHRRLVTRTLMFTLKLSIIEYNIEFLVIWDAMTLIVTSL